MQLHTNNLHLETSPYLLQHAENPVHWQAWSDELTKKLAEQPKLLLISIGYSACHWCHVMERESFEDPAIARLMNEHFIPIKIDREERPDVDQIYMTALQLMTGQGGWPLNIIALPDGRPVWGATYLPPAEWRKALQAVAEIYRDEPDKVLEYAEKLALGIQRSELIPPNPAPPAFSREETEALYLNWQGRFDLHYGGTAGAPKFPMPVNWDFLLDYALLSGNSDALNQVHRSLQAMVLGGIYDQLGGGFARYSTDEKWVVPHFEKMLYDNAQLISLYSKAYRQSRDPLYAGIIAESMRWINREMRGPGGQYYSALDADSEGEEGRYYVWQKADLQRLIGPADWPAFEQYYDLKKGSWEGNIILVRQAGRPFDEESEKKWRRRLLPERDQRVKPGLDHKILSSWNAMMISANLDAWRALGEESYRQDALQNAGWLLENHLPEEKLILHTRSGERAIDGLLEDYAHLIRAFLDLHEVSAEEKYLHYARTWMEYCLENFSEDESGLFYTRPQHGPQLIARSTEISDNVIPSANAVMANNLLRLGHIFLDEQYRQRAAVMLMQVKEQAMQYPGNFSAWAKLMLKLSFPFREIVISGPRAGEYYRQMNSTYLPNVLYVSATQPSSLPILNQRFQNDKTHIYVCENNHCLRPVQTVDEALAQL